MTDIQKRLSDVELVMALRTIGDRPIETAEEICAQAADALERLSAPPSQGKVERAREIAHNIVSYCREHRSNTDVPTYTREEAEEYVTSAITQALTESSRQGTDGACCEAMREAAAKVCDEHGFTDTDEAITADYIAKKIRALATPSQPAPVVAKREFTDTESDSLAQVGYLLDRLPSDDTDADWTSLENGTIRHLYTMARRASPQPDRESEGVTDELLFLRWAIKDMAGAASTIIFQTERMPPEIKAAYDRLASSTRPQATEGE